MIDEWTMEGIDAEGKPFSFKGKKSMSEMLIGTQNYLLKQREKFYENKTIKENKKEV